MKLAAVASAAIMMAPVALNSVSTFAATPATTTIATGAIPSTEAGFNTSLAIAKAVLKAAQVNGSDAAKTAVQSAKTDKGESATNWMNEIKAADAFLALAKKNGIDPTGAGVKSAKATFTADEIGEPGSWYVDQANGVPNSTVAVPGNESTTYAQYFKAISADIAGVISHFDAAAKTLGTATAADVYAGKTSTTTPTSAKDALVKAITAAKAAQNKATDAQRATAAYQTLVAATKGAQTVYFNAKSPAAALNAQATALNKVVAEFAAKSTNKAQSLSDKLNDLTKQLAATTNMSTKASIQAEINALVAKDTAGTNQAKKLSDKLNDLTKQLAATTNMSTKASIQAEINALVAQANKGNKANTRFTGVLKVTYVKGYGIQVWTKDGKMVASDAKGAKAGDKKKLQDGTSWKVFGPSVNINGHNMYNVGGNQYVDAKYVSFTHSVDLAK